MGLDAARGGRHRRQAQVPARGRSPVARRTGPTHPRVRAGPDRGGWHRPPSAAQHRQAGGPVAARREARGGVDRQRAARDRSWRLARGWPAPRTGGGCHRRQHFSGARQHLQQLDRHGPGGQCGLQGGRDHDPDAHLQGTDHRGDGRPHVHFPKRASADRESPTSPLGPSTCRPGWPVPSCARPSNCSKTVPLPTT